MKEQRLQAILKGCWLIHENMDELPQEMQQDIKHAVFKISGAVFLLLRKTEEDNEQLAQRLLSSRQPLKE